MAEGEPSERWTERARRALKLAEEEARAFNHNYLGTEHLLLGVARDEQMVSHRILGNLGVSADAIRQQIEAIIGRGDSPYTEVLDRTPRLKKVLGLAQKAADRLGHLYVGTEHFLLGLAAEGEGVGARILYTFGVDEDRIVRELERSQPVEAKPPAARVRDVVITCRVDADDASAIDALVEAGLRTTRSDAAAWLIKMGIAANADLFTQVFATADEIRRLRQKVLAADLRQQEAHQDWKRQLEKVRAATASESTPKPGS